MSQLTAAQIAAQLTPAQRRAVANPFADRRVYARTRATIAILAAFGLCEPTHLTGTLTVEGEKVHAILWPAFIEAAHDEALFMNKPKVCGATSIWDSGLACDRAPHDDNSVANPFGWMHTWEAASTRQHLPEIHAEALEANAKIDGACRVLGAASREVMAARPRAITADDIEIRSAGPNMTPTLQRAPRVGDLVFSGGLNRKGRVVREARRNRMDGFDVMWEGQQFTQHYPGRSLSIVDVPAALALLATRQG